MGSMVARLGLVLVAAVAALGQAGAGSTAARGNLIANGGAELGKGASDGTVVPVIPGWKRTGEFTVVRYGASGGFPDAAAGKAVRGGVNFFAGGPSNPASAVTQVVNVARYSASIDRGKATATLSGDLGGFDGQNDSLTVIASFLDASGSQLGAMHIGPVTPTQRKSATILVLRSSKSTVPPKTRTVRILLRAVRTDGSYNDGYADNLSLTLA